MAIALKGDHGSIEIGASRDRNASFEPQIVAKGQKRITGMDDQVLTFYAKGMSTRTLAVLLKKYMVWKYQ